LALRLHPTRRSPQDCQSALCEQERTRCLSFDKAKVLAELATRRQPSDEEIEAQAIEDEDAWTDEELAKAEAISPPPSPEQVRKLRARLGLSQAQFARRFGFTLDTVQQYEQGRRRPSGPASTLLRVIAADPESVERALRFRR
jgi:putative transcriptional regulator